MQALIGLVEAKGEGSLVTYRGQALVEMAAVKQSTIKEGNKRNYDATKTPVRQIFVRDSLISFLQRGSLANGGHRNADWIWNKALAEELTDAIDEARIPLLCRPPAS